MATVPPGIIATMVNADILGLSVDAWTMIGSVAAVISVVVALVALRPSRGQAPEGAPNERSTQAIDKTDQLELKLVWMALTYTDGTVGDFGIGLSLTNLLAHPVEWSSAHLELQDGSGRHAQLVGTAPPPLAVPKWVQPQTTEQVWVSEEAVTDSGFDLARPITAYATLGTGDRVQSKPWTANR